MEKRIELLSPARDLNVGIAAINNGADAVYIGAPAFGARRAASNSLEDIATLAAYAHRFWCRVFVTLNTIIYDNELPDVERLIRQLYEIGVDAIIIQDMGILELNLPPIAIHASTQMHNYSPERIRFLDQLGINRIVLARELSLEQIKAIRRETKAELEMFIHGALCVSLSGQCYLSQRLCGRSANRGECAQPCRQQWTLTDSNGRKLLKDKYVLSLKDLNLSASISELIEAGIDSFKIEGRLKDENYVANVTNYYSSLINSQPEVERIGAGRVVSSFTPDPERSFSRGYTEYFLRGRKPGMANMDTPKSVGKKVGVASSVKGNRLVAELIEEIHNGDGLCYFHRGELTGLRVNGVEGNVLVCNESLQIEKGTVLYRNYDHRFVQQTEREKSCRKIGVCIKCTVTDKRLDLKIVDENGVQAEYMTTERFEIATNPTQREHIIRQLAKSGDTDFVCDEVVYDATEVLFIPAATINAARRELLELLLRERELQRPKEPATVINSSVIFDQPADWRLNIVNERAAAFYRKHGADGVELGFERSVVTPGRELMRTRYCLLNELGRCRKQNKNSDLNFPLWLSNGKQQFRVDFDCSECFMTIIE